MTHCCLANGASRNNTLVRERALVIWSAAACGPFQRHQSEPGSESFMIAKTFAPFPGVKPFAIMEISRLTARQAWPAAPALPAR
jgi:hypothetical protein